MSATELLHEVEWTAATLSEEPLSFKQVVFVVGERSAWANERISTYQTQLSEEGYTTTVVTNPADIIPLLTPKTTASPIVIHIPHVAHTRDEVYKAVVSSCNALLAIAQLLISGNNHNNRSSKTGTGTGTRIGSRVRLFCMVTKDEHSAFSELSYAPLYGLARVLKTEMPEIFGGLFVAENKAMGFPLLAFKYALGFDVVRVCENWNEQRCVPLIATLRPISPHLSNGAGDKNVKSPQLNKEATYLITGGTSGVGLEIASWMVKHGARHLLLVARNSVSSQGDGNVVTRIAELEAQGAAVHVLAIDLSLHDAETALRQGIARLEVPGIKGVVHAAAIADYYTLKSCSLATVADSLSPDVRGALNLDAVFPPGTLDFFILMSSIGQLVGFPVQLLFAPSNAFLDGLATRRRRDGDNAISIQSSPWRGVELTEQSKHASRMLAKNLGDSDIADISPEEALAAWGRILILNTGQVTVVRALKVENKEPLRHQMPKNITPPRSKEGLVHTGHQYEYPDGAVAVVGMACRTAAGDTPDQLWQAIEGGKSMVHEPDAARFRELREQKNAKGKLWGNFLPGGIQSFDHKFFDKSKREATALDPHQRLLLETTYHALEAAGWADAAPEVHGDSRTITGCFIGMSAQDYFLNQASHPPSPYTAGGMLRSFVAGRLSHYFGWTGPSNVIDTACSSSMVAIHQACRALQVGECTQAVAGGVNIISNMALFQALQAGSFLSPTGACKTFDAQADGYCRGEAVGVVSLKLLHRALEDGDEIHGVVLASSNNQNMNYTSITNPVVESQKALYRDVLARAQVCPSNISYVEAHGTGTRAGDPIEMESIRQVMGGTKRESLLHVGSVKANIGHCETAAGVISLIKVLLMMKHDKIPAQVHFKDLNPRIPPLGPDRMAIATSLREWTQDNQLRLALVNNYGASGSNAAAVVASPPSRAFATVPAWSEIPKSSAWPICISAASEASIRRYCDKLVDYAGEGDNNISLAQLAYALATKKRRRFKYILSTTATSMDDLRDKLRSPEICTPVSKPIVLLFSGQNGDTTPSARCLYESSSLFRARLQECEEAMQYLGLPSPVPAVLAGIKSSDDTDLVLRHATLFSLQYACGMSWIDSGITPQAICGHSFGEWAALTVSGALPLEAGRASIIQKLWGPDTGCMVAIEADLMAMNITPEQHLQPFFNAHPELKLDFACYNGPNNYVVAGKTRDVYVLAAYLKTQQQHFKALATRPPREKLRFKVLNGMHAYHSHMADSIVNECAILSASIPLRTPTYPFESCHWGRKIQQEQDDKQMSEPWSGHDSRFRSDFIARNTRGPVYFGEAIQRIVARVGKPCTFLEAGIGSPIITMAQKALTPCAVPTQHTDPDDEHTFIPISGTDPQRSLAEAIAMLWKRGTVNAQFWPFYQSQQASFLTPQGRFVELPPYQFESHCHWLDYSSHRSDTTPNSDPQGSLANHITHETEASDECPHCHKSITDFPYIIPDKSTTDSSSDPHFTFTLDTRNARYQKLVSGHAVVGTPICPAAMYIEAVVHALLLLQSKDRQIPIATDILCSFVIKDLEIRAPLGLATGAQRAVKLTLCKDKNRQGTWRFELFSSSKNGAKNGRTMHSIGAVTPVTSLNGVFEEIKEDGRQLWSRAFDLLHSDPNTDAIRGGMVYKLFATMVRYSDAYKLLHYLAGKGSECAGEIAVPTGDQSVVEVLLVDNFLQAAGAYMHSLRSFSDADEQGKTESLAYICTGMGTVAALDQLSGDTQYRAYTRLVREDGRNAILDIFAFHCGRRRLVWCAKGLRFTRIPRSSLVKSLAPASCGSDQQQQGQVAVSLSTNGHNADSSNNNNNEKEQDVFSGVQTLLSSSLDVPTAEITREALLEELGIDSLVSPEILSGISDRFQVEITVPDFAEIPDVATLCDNIIAQGHGEKTRSQATGSASFHPLADNVMEVLSRSLDLARDEIDMTSRLEDLGVDSLVAPEIISNLRTVLNVDISVVDFAETVDVAALCQLARGRPGSARSASTPSAYVPAKQDPRRSEYLHGAFLQVRRRFDTYASAIGFTGFWENVYPQQLRTVVAFIIEAFDKLGCSIQNYAPGQKLPTIDGILPKYKREMSRLWEILMEAGLVEQETAQGSYIRGPAHMDDTNNNRALKQSTKLITDFPTCSAAHGLLAHLGPHLAECLTGEVNPVSLLFSTDQGQQLLDGFYRDAPEFRAASSVLGDFLSSTIQSHASTSFASSSDPFHIIEIGAGTGGTTKHLVPLLQATGIPFKYTFTDISASLVARARKSTFKDATNMEFLKLDITEPPPIHLQGQYHVVISANCVHATPNITQSLANAHKLVRDGDGCVALLELTQRLPWYDLVWGLLDGWWLYNDGRDYPLQAPWVWEAAMRNAGFGHVDWSESRSRESRSMSVIVGFTTPQVQPKQQTSLKEKEQQSQGDLKRACTACVSSLLVHRGSSPNAPNLFLVPGGRGLGSIFKPFGKYLVDSGTSLSISIYALSSPASMRTPRASSKNDIITLEEYASACIADIKRRQPQGPYMLGGWSSGGIVSFEMVRQLQEAGDEVTKLVLIDTACPIRPTWYPDSVIEFIFSTLPPELKLGMQSDNLESLKKEARGQAKSKVSFPGKEDSDDDFDFSVGLDDSGIATARIQMENYRCSPLSGRKMPLTILVSARRGMVNGEKNVHELGLDPDFQWIANWLSNDRDEGPLGWDQLMGAENVRVIRADSDHYSIVQMPPGLNGWVSELVELLEA